jgi:hypothetical protein
LRSQGFASCRRAATSLRSRVRLGHRAPRKASWRHEGLGRGVGWCLAGCRLREPGRGSSIEYRRHGDNDDRSADDPDHSASPRLPQRPVRGGPGRRLRGRADEANKGAPTPEEALQEYVQESISSYSRASETDPAYVYLQPSEGAVAFVRREQGGRRTMSVWVRPSNGGGWEGKGHIKCEE